MKIKKSNRNCVICKQSVLNELELGVLKVTKAIRAHYYCLLFSDNITQSGEDDQGILGFLSSDILSEVRLCRNQVCCYCKGLGASSGCVNKFCNRKFHLPCGINNNTQHNFISFTSLCDKHRKPSNIPPNLRRRLDSLKCVICMENFTKEDTPRFLVWASCCKADIILHLNCIRQLALSAGYFTKCPGCNNNKEFLTCIKTFGVFVPERDASWETVDEAYSELYQTHNICDVSPCNCPQGRKFSTPKGKWKLVLCHFCGAYGTHQGCSDLKNKFVCPVCNISSDSEDENTKNHKYNIRKRLQVEENLSSSEDEDVELAVVSESEDELDNKNSLLELLKGIPTSVASAPIKVEKQVALKSTTKLPNSNKAVPFIESKFSNISTNGGSINSWTVHNINSEKMERLQKNSINSWDDIFDLDLLPAFGSKSKSNCDLKIYSSSQSAIENKSNFKIGEVNIKLNEGVPIERKVAMKSTTKLSGVKRNADVIAGSDKLQKSQFSEKCVTNNNEGRIIKRIKLPFSRSSVEIPDQQSSSYTSKVIFHDKCIQNCSTSTFPQSLLDKFAGKIMKDHTENAFQYNVLLDVDREVELNNVQKGIVKTEEIPQQSSHTSESDIIVID